MDLKDIQRPSRYINNEIHAIHKAAPLRFALCFPDIYDIGMSHLGLRILYAIINSLPYAVAERVFHPWSDAEEALRSSNTPLSSLESGTPLNEFDIVGFSLQYELCYPTVLSMLSLGGVPIRSNERTDEHPIVIAGGPCTINPMPMSAFMDAFLVGDGEDAVVEISEAVHRWKSDGDGQRASVLQALSGIEGVYVPGVSTGPVKRRFIDSLDDAPYPIAPIVPYAQIVHDRLNVEISRGCTMGCRYCQAGMVYRPLRERSPDKVLEIAEQGLKATGYDEVSFTSLSAGDYSCLLPLVREFNNRFSSQKVSISLPSLRVKAVNREMLREISSVRKSGFTIAPEAATERLRRVINKDFTEEDYERAAECLFGEGWLNLKLYYMVGLPTETHEDVEAIPRMVRSALKTARKYTKRQVKISVSASPFVPKAHTPFQWWPQESMQMLKEKREYLRGNLKGATIRGHDENMSVLEAALARGDKGIAGLIEAAYRAGARLDGWSEHFSFDTWLSAMEQSGVDAFAYAEKRYSLDGPLPWDIVDTGIEVDFLRAEYKAATEESFTEDCRQSCVACGLGCGDKAAECEAGVTQRRPPPPLPEKKPVALRAEFQKTGPLRYLSHRELMNLITRALKRAGVRLQYSQGFNPSPRLSFGPPLIVGAAGLREYFDMRVIPGQSMAKLKDMINAELNEYVKITAIHALAPEEPSLQSFISSYEYEIICPDAEAVRLCLQNIEQGKAPEGMVTHAEESGPKAIRLTLRDTEQKRVKLNDLMPELFGLAASALDITRLRMSGRGVGGSALNYN